MYGEPIYFCIDSRVKKFLKKSIFQEAEQVNIIVFIKQVADTEGRIVISQDKKSLEIENKYAMNFFDEFAVEEALRIREKIGGSVTAVTYGSPRTSEVLKTAIAMGVDKAFLIDGSAVLNDDPLFKAEALSAFAKKEGFDLILAGRQAIDDENAAIGPMAAELLNIPHVSVVTRLNLLDGKVAVERDAEGGKEMVEVTLPALVTTQKGLNEPRVPLITGVMKAMKATVPVVDPHTLDVSRDARTHVLSYEAPPKRPPVKIAEGETPREKVENLIRLLKEEARAL
jgi:electron transfer flavoprotein beta subunit